MAEVQAGEAVIDLFYYIGKTKNMSLFATLDKNSGCGVQCLSKIGVDYVQIYDDEGVKVRYCKIDSIASNEGLSIDDFKSWFKGYDISRPMAIIHFTPFRY